MKLNLKHSDNVVVSFWLSTSFRSLVTGMHVELLDAGETGKYKTAWSRVNTVHTRQIRLTLLYLYTILQSVTRPLLAEWCHNKPLIAIMCSVFWKWQWSLHQLNLDLLSQLLSELRVFHGSQIHSLVLFTVKLVATAVNLQELVVRWPFGDTLDMFRSAT